MFRGGIRSVPMYRVLAKASEANASVRRVSTFALATARTSRRNAALERRCKPDGLRRPHVDGPQRVRSAGRTRRAATRCVIDIEHNEAGVAGAKDVAGPTAGYARLELRDGAPWIVFDWSDVAIEQIRTGQRKFISPDYHVNKDTGEIVGLSRVSLVANPGTHRARMLASAKGSDMDPNTVAGLIAILTATDDPAANAAAALAFLSGHQDSAGGADESVDPDGPPPAPVAADAAPDAAPEEKPKEGDPMPFKKPEDKKPEEDKKPADPAPVSAAAEAPKPVAASAIVAAPVIDLVARRELDVVRRDGLIKDHAAKLSPQIKAWAASQPFAVVKAYVDALPADLEPPARVTATRGEGQGGTTSPYGRDGFQPGSPEFAEFQRMTGTATPAPIGPQILANGTLRINAGCPGEWRKQEAARVRAAGKAK